MVGLPYESNIDDWEILKLNWYLYTRKTSNYTGDFPASHVWVTKGNPFPPNHMKYLPATSPQTWFMNTSKTKPGFRLGQWYHVVSFFKRWKWNKTKQQLPAKAPSNGNISGPPGFPAPQFPSPIPTTVGLPYPRLAWCCDGWSLQRGPAPGPHNLTRLGFRACFQFQKRQACFFAMKICPMIQKSYT